MDESLINRGRKFEQVLRGARHVFLRDGFEGTSVDEIAREAGVSKATLYSYFPDKRLMFVEVFRNELRQETADSLALLQLDRPFSEVLPMIVQMITAHLASEFGVRVYRISVAEAERFPTLSREYFESGPQQLEQTLSLVFRLFIERGELQIDDLEIAASTLIQLCTVVMHHRALFLGPEAVTEDMLRRTCENAVHVFLSAYATEKPMRN